MTASFASVGLQCMAFLRGVCKRSQWPTLRALATLCLTSGRGALVAGNTCHSRPTQQFGSAPAIDNCNRIMRLAWNTCERSEGAYYHVLPTLTAMGAPAHHSCFMTGITPRIPAATPHPRRGVA